MARHPALSALGQALAEAVQREIAGERARLSALPKLPPFLYGSYREPPSLPLPGGLQDHRILTGYGLLSHNESLWISHYSGDLAALFDEAESRLQMAGWHREERYLGKDFQYLRLGRGNQTLRLYVPSEEEMLDDSRHGHSRAVPLVLHYSEAFSKTEREAAIDRLLAQNPPVETLLLFQPLCTPAQKAMLAAKIEASRPASPTASLHLPQTR